MDRQVDWRQDRDAMPEAAYLGNGVFGLRVGVDPFAGGRLIPGGLWGDHPMSGIRRLVDLPSPLAFSIQSGSERRKETRMVPETASMDYRTATYHTQGRCRLGDETRVQYESRHWVSRAHPFLATVELTLIPEITADLTLRTLPQEGALVADSVEIFADAPGRGPGLGTLRQRWRARGSHSEAVFQLAIREAGGAVPSVRYQKIDQPPDQLVLHWPQAEAGKPLRVVFHLIVVTTAQHPSPIAQAQRLHRWLWTQPAEAWRAAHEANWAEVWRGRIQTDAGAETQGVLDASLYNLFASASPASLAAMSPFGLSSDGYNGHVFWDCETWTLPPFMLLEPETARVSLQYRRDRLAAAQTNATLHGFRGAMFPWESSDSGMEDTPPTALSGPLQHHVSADIAFAFRQFQTVAGDRAWMRDVTWPVLREVAEWVCSRVTPSARGFEIRHVMGADEFSVNVHNSAHTNLVCREALRGAIACAGAIGEEAPARWAAVAEGLVIPRDPDSGLILQQDGWTPAHRAKQADTLLAVFPLNVIPDPVDVAAIIEAHVPKDPESSYTVAMGDQVHAVTAARIGKRELAAGFFRRGWEPFWKPIWGAFSESPHHTAVGFQTGHGGVVQAALLGFAGLQLEDPKLMVHPTALPEGWDHLTVERIHHRGRAWRLEARQGEMAKLTAIEGD